MLELLEHEHRARLAHHEPVAVGVERPRPALRIVVPLRERAHRAETCDADPGHRRLGTSAEHDIRAAEPDRVEPVADRHVRRRARGRLGGERAPRAELHRNPGGGHVRDDLDDREGPDAVGAALEEDLEAVLEGAEPADPGGNRGANPVRFGGDRQIPLSASAIRAAERAICEKRSILRACFRSIHTVGSKSRSSHANRTG